MITKKEYYKGILQNNAYINLNTVKDFLQNNCVADYEVIAEIFNKGMTLLDWQDLQQALDEIEI